MQYLMYIIPVAIVLIIFTLGFAKARKTVIPPTGDKEGEKPTHSGIFEISGVNQESNHVLGAVQSTIYGRIRFLAFGIMLIGISLFGLYIFYMTDLITEYSTNPLAKLAMTVFLIGGVVWGLQLISFITFRVRLRRRGFEISSIFGTKAYEYKDVNFYLTQTVEHKYESDGYRPVIMKAGSYNFLWVCQIVFNDGSKPIILKSSRYVWLKNKIQRLIEALYGSKN